MEKRGISRYFRTCASRKCHHLEVFFLPPYAPEYNPDEYWNHTLKLSVHSGQLPDITDDISHKIQSFMRKLQQHPPLVSCFFHHPVLSYIYPKKQTAKAFRGKSIEIRPKEIKKRERFGYWEMDSVMGCEGSKKTLPVLTDRRTRMGIIMQLDEHTAASVVKAVNRLERRFGKLFYNLFKSITVDNGCEFQDFLGG